MIIRYSDLSEEKQNILLQVMLETSKVENDKLALREKMKELGMALYYNVNPEKINDPSFSSAKIREIRLYEKDGFDSSLYSSYDAKKMYEIRLGLKRELDMAPVLEYNADQIEAINNRFEELSNSSGENIITLKDVLIDLGLIEKEIVEPVLEKLSVEEIPVIEDNTETVVEEQIEPLIEGTTEVIENTEISEEPENSITDIKEAIEEAPVAESIETSIEESNLTLDEKIEINTDDDIFAVDNDIPDELKKLFDFEL